MCKFGTLFRPTEGGEGGVTETMKRAVTATTEGALKATSALREKGGEVWKKSAEQRQRVSGLLTSRVGMILLLTLLYAASIYVTLIVAGLV